MNFLPNHCSPKGAYKLETNGWTLEFDFAKAPFRYKVFSQLVRKNSTEILEKTEKSKWKEISIVRIATRVEP